MTKVMLINPNRKQYAQSLPIRTYMPIGLLSVASMIKNISELKILDCLIEDFQKTKINDYYLCGTPFEKIKEKISYFNPDIVGISIPFTAQYENACEIAKICKEIRTKTLVVFGGPDASVRYKTMLKEYFCDFCVVGEGEDTFHEFIEKYIRKQSVENIKGLAYKKDERIYFTPREYIGDLDKLPLPAYDLIDIEPYLENKFYKPHGDINRAVSIITSRGCPFECVFCSIKAHMGRNFRVHSPNYVISHIKYLMKNYHIRNFIFEDDNISLNQQRFEALLDQLIKNKLNIRWNIINGIRADTLNYLLLRKMKKSGCRKLTIAIESGSSYVLNNVIKKKSSFENLFVEITGIP